MTCTSVKSVLSEITLVLHLGGILGFLGRIYVVSFPWWLLTSSADILGDYLCEIDIEIVHTSCYLPGLIEYGAFA